VHTRRKTTRRWSDASSSFPCTSGRKNQEHREGTAHACTALSLDFLSRATQMQMPSITSMAAMMVRLRPSADLESKSCARSRVGRPLARSARGSDAPGESDAPFSFVFRSRATSAIVLIGTGFLCDTSAADFVPRLPPEKYLNAALDTHALFLVGGMPCRVSAQSFSKRQGCGFEWPTTSSKGPHGAFDRPERKDGNGHELSAYPRVKNRWVWVWVPFHTRGYGYG
jgi:hypothetical protein